MSDTTASCLNDVGLQEYAVDDLASIFIIEDDVRGEKSSAKRKERKCAEQVG